VSGLDNPFTGLQRSRRNLLRATAILASAIMAKTTSAAADDGNEDDGNGDRGRRRHVHCFLKGTMIRTADGDRKIENLAVADLLPTVFSGTCPIQWIGRSRFKRSYPNKPWVRDVLPIRVARSALGSGVPHADLYLTQGHALLIDGMWVAAGNLVHGTTITRYEARELGELEYFQIKLEAHDAIYAEGAPCESLYQVDDNFANCSEYVRQYGPPKTAETRSAPLLGYGGPRGEIKSCFRSALSPWIDRRQQVDIIRDRLETRGIALLREAEFMA